MLAIITTGLLGLGLLAQDADETNAVQLQVEVEIANSGQEPASEVRSVILGDDWAYDQSENTTIWYDFSDATEATLDAESDQLETISTHAIARQNIDIYAGLTNNGQLTTINFGDAGTFHRFWLEAALDVRAQPAELTVRDGQDNRVWSFDGEDIVSIRFADCFEDLNTPVGGQIYTAWLRRSAPLHPEISNAIAIESQAPCELTFRIYSPDSPQGRQETWRITQAENISFNPEDLEIVEPTGLEALLDEDEEPLPTPDMDSLAQPLEFFSTIQTASSEERYVEALLTGIQEEYHFGPCPEQSIGTSRMACAVKSGIAQQAGADDDFEQISTAFQAAQTGDHDRAVGLFHDYLDRTGTTGSAVKTLVATSLLSWGPEGLTRYPEMNPVELLIEAIREDPQATDAYWYLGQILLQQRQYDLAWQAFDAGRPLIGERPGSRLAGIEALEDQIEALAPGYFPNLSAED